MPSPVADPVFPVGGDGPVRGQGPTVEGYIEGLSKEEGDNKIIKEANSKATADNLSLLVVAIITITGRGPLMQALFAEKCMRKWKNWVP